MAQFIGKSGAWDSICRKMNMMGFKLDDISDIKRILDDEKEKLEIEKEMETQLLEKEDQAFTNKKNDLSKSYQEVIRSNKEKIIEKLKTLSLEIEYLQEPTTFFKKLKRKYPIFIIKGKIKALKKKANEYFENLKTEWDIKQNDLEKQHEKAKFDIVGKVRKTEHNIKSLQHIQKTPDLFGAIAEIELIENLTSLPQNYYILNDVFLDLGKSMRFDDKWRRSAQVDTMVISPAGIFVVEVKNWSKTFIASNDYHDPYDQVKWAAYLCYKQTKIKTRSIIAHTGNIPPKPQGSYAKVLRLNEVKNYIFYFDDKVIIDNEEIEGLADYFK
ncbi:MAG: NERD domain-containing protein [Anaerolineae bacterium]|nr:NERD domain-containing protein [Anaerolineae bacterium]MBT3714619.1 NERD domain-containing protein [Anaerolineae bacterium]MBT4311083.1 NERD domain-containing protein [Anaerolineae bacterium]MBT4458334.1 NERD domain-containing protein [Anaerolineae bacterium]MBT4842771.1 NERD domain-containing protein [Anaerolineae bacterium]